MVQHDNMEVQEKEQDARDKNRKRSGFGKGFISGLLAAVLLLVTVGCTVRYRSGDSGTSSLFKKDDTSGKKTESSEDGESELLDANTSAKLDQIQELLDMYCLYDYSEDDLRAGICKGAVNAVGDPYTVYFDEEETKALYETTSGNYGGIGVVMTQDPETGIISVVRCYKDSPSDGAGIQAGDILTKVEGERVQEGDDLSEIVAKVRGKIGTEVELTFARDGEEKDYKIERASIDVQTVVSKELSDGIGYIEVSEFDDVTYDQFKTAYEDLRGKDIKGLIVDLRGNPGGNVDTTCNMLDLLLPDGLLVYTEDKNGEIEEYRSKGDDQIDIPMTILVNGDSASASEIFTGACQDRKIATVVGTQSFGKGVVQSIIPLGDDTSIKITIAKYYTPEGQDIHGKGITPDVEVEMNEGTRIMLGEDIDPTKDNQLQKAIEVLQEEIKQ